MLRSTGFFRGIDCPFYTESLNGRSDSDRCNRPYCHFRHSKQRRALCSPGNNRKTNDSSSKQKEQGYDPYIPEVVRPGGQPNGQPTSVPVALDQGALELELVNRAIEAVRNEVEREQKKLSRIGDQEYDPTDSGVKMGAKRHKLAPLEYDPDSYQMAPAAGYNPTPASSKYTLDSDNESTCASSLEYVPTTVTKTAIKVPTSLSPTSCSPSLSSNPPPVSACSSRHKYTLDNSKPPTDLEYDPLSNFSARPGSKNNKSLKDQRTLGAAAGRGVGSNKRLRSAAMETEDEGYVPTLKKPRLLQPVAVVESQKYTASFSESDEESSGTEYRPTSISRLRNKKNSGAFIEDWNGEEAGDSATPAGLKQQQLSWQGSLQCDTKDSESSAGGLLEEKTVGRKGTIKNSHSKSGRASKVGSEEREPHRKGAGGKDRGGGDCKKPDASKKSGKEGSKKDGKSEGGKVDEKIRPEGDHIDKGSKELKKVKGDGRSVKTGKVKSESEQKDRRGGESHGKAKCPDRNRKESPRLNELKNGKPEGGEGDLDKRQSGHARKDKAKKAGGLPDGKAPKPRTERQRSLSHADLFGDESGEDEDEGTVVRKSAAAFKRGSLMRRKRVASESAGSSSGGEDGQEDDDDDDGDVGVDYTKLQVDLDFDSDPMEECLRIFNESKDVKTEDRGRQAKQPPPPKETENEEDTDSTLTTLFPGQKKRVSHFMTKPNAETTSKPVVRPYRRPTAQEICYQRMQIAQQQAAQLAAVAKMTTATAGPASSFSLEKRRVAHRPNPSVPAANSGIQGASSLSPSSRTFTGSPSLSLKAHTSASILSKTTSTAAQKRVAHTPTLKSSSLKRPVIPTEFGAKVPTNVRQRYLNIFIDECLKFCPSEEMAFQKALEEEKLVYDRSSSRNIYLNVAVNTLKKLRSKSSSCTSPMAKSPAKSANKKSLSHEEVLGGRLAAKTSFTINRTGRQQEEELTGATLYRKLKEYLMTEEQLQEHCYPRPHPQRSGRAMVYNVPEKKNADPFSKVCCRCGAEYKVASNGNCVRREECTHHWGRLRRQRVPGGWETQYNCCSGAVGSPGCQVAKQHVQDGRKEALDGYVKTFNKPLPPDGNAGVYALDCEMCYTKQGLELTRVTVVNSELKVIYDTFVKPVSKVVDYNTRFSGVTQEDLESVTITLRDVQAVLLNMFSSDSILIGHSLESDFFALKLIHSTVVDTAIVFPHRLGLPYKRALRTLMADYLKRIIQDNVEGHNSSEDASACMELMMWKIREDAKVKR